MKVTWTPEIEQRFTELRLRKLSGSLTETEQKELAEIRALVEVVESQTTAAALKRLQSEQAALRDVLDNLQEENRELMQLFDRTTN